MFKKYPLIGEDITNRHVMYNEELQYVHECEKDGTALVMDKAKLESIYRLGYQNGLENIEKVKEFLK